MAQVTVELRRLLKNGFKLFDFPYQFDDHTFKEELEQAVIDHYAFSEIGQETPDRFKHVFKTRWLSFIDYYNKLYNTTLLEYDPLINYKITEALEQLRNTEGTENTIGNTNSGGESKTTHQEDAEHTNNTDNLEEVDSNNKRTDDLKHTDNTKEEASDYPQQTIGTGKYLSGARISDNSGTNMGTVEDKGQSTTTTNTAEEGTNNTTGQNKTTTEDTEDSTQNTQTTGQDSMEYRKTIEGITGKSYQELIDLERKNIIRIKDMVIRELKSCFIMVY